MYRFFGMGCLYTGQLIKTVHGCMVSPGYGVSPKTCSWMYGDCLQIGCPTVHFYATISYRVCNLWWGKLLEITFCLCYWYHSSMEILHIDSNKDPFPDYIVSTSHRRPYTRLHGHPTKFWCHVTVFGTSL